MREFGSDFHFVSEYNSQKQHLTDIFPNAVLLADGRQCIVSLILQENWRRIWMPEYFCYEVIETLRAQTDIVILFYPDSPLCDDRAIVKELPYEDGDVLVRMNFFGLRGSRSEIKIPVPVIEDHTHDLLGSWALNSDADWCIASLRKSLPLPEGGIIWSPKGYHIVDNISQTAENEEIAKLRWKGMELKTQYLAGKTINKEEFRKLFIDTEQWFDTAIPVLIDNRSKTLVTKQLDINLWQDAKQKNWRALYSFIHNSYIQVLLPEDESCTMFSFIILLPDKERRDSVRTKAINEAVYPAILWNLNENVSEEARYFSDRMLSFHCDGRYNEDDIKQLAGVLNKIFEE